MLDRGAAWLADSEQCPDSVAAVAGYYNETGVFDPESLLLKRRVDSVVDKMLDRLFAELEREIAAELGYGTVAFSYDTKLLLPAKLTLGHLYRTLEPADHLRAEEMTRLAVEGLLDGDMRDALNDEEFEAFGLDRETSTDERRRVAAVAQAHLEGRVERQLEAYADPVRDIYDRAVALSDSHQERDRRFRALMAAVERGEQAPERIAAEYRDPGFDDPPELFTEADLSLPYLKTQYERVGVLYDAMLAMYRKSGLPVERPFRRAVVFAIVGAQIWLDDVEDFEADIRAGQLTPVTAEYLLAGPGDDPREAVRSVTEAYLDRAREAATAADSTLTGIAVEYIRRTGDPASLPPGVEFRQRTDTGGVS